MNPKHLIVGALALLLPTAAPALAFAQDYAHLPQAIAPQGYTELRVAPPPGGQVYVYDGHRLLGRFDRAGALMVPTGHPYRVVATRGDTQLWEGNVTAAGVPLDLNWSAVERYREPIAPPPPAYGYGRPYQAPPPSGYYPVPPPQAQEAQPYGYGGYGGYGGYQAPVIGTRELRSLLHELDTEADDQDRLAAIADAASRYSFAVPQADWILGRFRSDAYRLAALERMRDHIIDRDDAFILLQRFRGVAAREQAQHMLGW